MLHIIGGKHKNRKLQVCQGAITRPTSGLVREAIFNILQVWIEEKTVLDLCAGSGAVGLEALSRGAKHASFLEKDRTACLCIKKNITTLKCEAQSTVFCADALSTLLQWTKQNRKFDFIYLDPPYASSVQNKERSFSLAEALLLYIDQGQLLAKNGQLFLECSTDTNFKFEKELNYLQLFQEKQYGKSRLFIFHTKLS